MRSTTILFKDEPAGILSQLDNGSFHFRYNETWLEDKSKPAISLTMPKLKVEFRSHHLFPPFFIYYQRERTNRRCANLRKLIRLIFLAYYYIPLNLILVERSPYNSRFHKCRHNLPIVLVRLQRGMRPTAVPPFNDFSRTIRLITN